MTYARDTHIRTVALTKDNYAKLTRASKLTGISGAQLINLALSGYLTGIISRATGGYPSTSTTGPNGARREVRASG